MQAIILDGMLCVRTAVAPALQPGMLRRRQLQPLRAPSRSAAARPTGARHLPTAHLGSPARGGPAHTAGGCTWHTQHLVARLVSWHQRRARGSFKSSRAVEGSNAAFVALKDVTDSAGLGRAMHVSNLADHHRSSETHDLGPVLRSRDGTRVGGRSTLLTVLTGENHHTFWSLFNGKR